MNIIIVNTQSIPSSGVGAASVNRILSYTKGLIEEGNNVSILTTAVGTDSSWQQYEGIPVKHLGRESSFFFTKVLNYLRTFIRLLKELSKSKKDVVLFVTSNYFLMVFLEFYCKITGTKIVNERSEYPFVLIRKSKWKRLIAPLYTNTAFKLLDGMVIMTKPLMEYYQKKTNSNCKLFEMPMTVDVDRFLNTNSQNIIGDYVAFCGSLSNTNGISNLIEAFSIVEPLYPNLKLLIIGGTPIEKDMNNYREAISKYGLKNVVFYGKVDRNDMPSLLNNARALLLARPSSLQSTGGFPTKLGEYLATGRPVVVTAVGDIPLYLNSSNSYIVKPDDNKAFAQKIMEILSDEDRASKIGKEGQKLAMTIFSAKGQSRKLDKYLKSLLI